MKHFLHIMLWVVEFALGLAFIVAMLIFTLPWLISFDSTRSIILGVLEGPLKGHLTIEKAEASWWDGTDFEKLVYVGKSGRMSVTCDKISTNATLWQICFGAHDIGNLLIENPIATMTLEEQPVPAPHTPVAFQAAGLPSMADLELQKIWQNLTPHLTGTVLMTNGMVIVQGKTIENVSLGNLRLEAFLPQSSSFVKFSLTGATRQEQQEGSLEWNGTFGPIESITPILSVNGNLKKLPVVGADQIVSIFYPKWEGILLSAIGPTLDLTMELSLGNQQLNLLFDAASSQFNAALRTITQNGQVSLVAPAHFGLMLTPYLAEYFFNLSPYMLGLSLANSPRLGLDIAQLEIPVSNDGLAWSKLKMDAVVNLLDMKFATPVLFNGIAIEHLKASLKTSLLENELDFSSSTNISFGDKTAFIAASGSFTHPLDEQMASTTTLSTQNFPVVILDQVFSSKGFLQNIFGATCAFSGGINKSEGKRSGILYFSSPNVNLAKTSFILRDDGITLEEPTQITFAPAKDFWETYTGGFGTQPAQVAIQTLDLTYGNSDLFKATGKASSPAFFYKKFSMNNPSIDFTFQGLPSVQFNAQAEGLTAQAFVGFDTKKDTFSLKKPFSIAFDLSPAQAETLWAEFTPPPTFQEPLSIKVEVKPFNSQLGQNLLNNVSIDGSLAIPLVKLLSPGKTVAILQNGVGTFNLNTKNNTIIFRTDASVGGDENTLVPFHSEGIFRNMYFQPQINFSDPQFLIKVAVENLNTQFIDAWRLTTAPLLPILGSAVSFKCEVMKAPTSGAIDVDASCEKGNCSIHLARQDDTLFISSRKPTSATWSMDQDGFHTLEQLLKRELPLTLTEKANLEIRITQLEVPLKPKSLEIDFAQLPKAKIDSIFQAETLKFSERSTKQPVTLNHLSCKISHPDATSQILFNLKTAVDAAKPGLVDVKGKLSGIHHTPQGWDVTHLEANIDAHFQQLPTTVVDTFTTAAGMSAGTITTLFGNQISGTFQTTLVDNNGPLSLQINAPSTRVGLDGKIENGVLLLNQPLFAQMTLTEGISKVFLQGVNPLSIRAIRSDGPMTLTIQDKGFAFPLFPWNLAQAKVDQARIEIGKLVCKNEGNINAALSLMKLAQFTKSKDLHLWFAPMDVSLKNGVIDCQRTEILVAEKLDVCTWGEIDLIKNRVDAVLGLTAQALSKAFGIKDLNDNYVLRIPMTGPINDVKINMSKATKKVALLLAWQKASDVGGSLGGSKGAIIGGVAGLVKQLPDGNSPPPPAKHPFPWEDQNSQPAKTPKKKRKSVVKPGDKPLKQLIKLVK